jgi:uncharacterized protein (TIGR02466 family)
MDTERVCVFSTDIVMVQLSSPKSLGPLRQAILAERASHPGLSVSQVGGWHSVPDLAQRPAEPFRPLIESIVQAVSGELGHLAAARGLRLPHLGWAVQAWATVLSPGGYNRVHDHISSNWSVAFYVDAGDPDSELGGVLSFVDPRRSALNIPGLELDPATLDVRPRTGMLVIFPGYLQHMVHPYDGTRPRVVVSANLSARLAPPEAG